MRKVRLSVMFCFETEKLFYKQKALFSSVILIADLHCTDSYSLVNADHI
jgi:hypothetical protein